MLTMGVCGSYLAVMKMGAQGHWLWHDLYTSVPHPGIVVHSVYILLGHFQGLTHLQVRPILAPQLQVQQLLLTLR